MRPVCVKCGVVMAPEKNGVWFVSSDGYDDPYLAYRGDVYKCHECGTMIVSGFSREYVDLHVDKEAYKNILSGSMGPVIREGRTNEPDFLADSVCGLGVG